MRCLLLRRNVGTPKLRCSCHVCYALGGMGFGASDQIRSRRDTLVACARAGTPAAIHGPW